tara:strand:- start:173 stop:430 length:258 start_codon:yes stop_codon:yes gene_type:complete
MSKFKDWIMDEQQKEEERMKMSKDKKDNWVAWSYNSFTADVVQDTVDEINDMLKQKNIRVNYYLDDNQEDWDYKLELDLQENESE